MDIYNQIKKQNGEKFAQALRTHHSGILEIPDIVETLRHAGREAEPLLPYLTSLLASNDDIQVNKPSDPFAMLEQAGYNAFLADTHEKQNSISSHFEQGELLCTFNDAARYKNYYIIHAVKKDVASILRKNFNGNEKREDAYGTSVISIQIAKKGGFISIKNRYNHTVQNPDNTFNSNPDNIIEGLSAALKEHFKVDFSAKKSSFPEGFELIGNQVFKYYKEYNGIYYGDNAWVKNGTIHAVDKSAGDAMFDYFLFDGKTKSLKKIDSATNDSFADDFNRDYGGNSALIVKDGNLILNGEILIGAEKSRIKTINLPALTEMGYCCLQFAYALTEVNAPALKELPDYLKRFAPSRSIFKAIFRLSP